MNDRFEKQLAFLTEIDKMKTVLRQTLIADKSKRENDAEHSWHFAVMAMIFFEYAGSPETDMFRVLKMALVHDLIEIYAGDTFAYDVQANEGREEREALAADKLFALLPHDQGTEIKELWLEFEQAETPDAMYAAAIDRLQPFINNYLTDGHTWKLGNVTRSQVLSRMDNVRTGAPQLWPFVEEIISLSVKKGYIKD